MKRIGVYIVLLLALGCTRQSSFESSAELSDVAVVIASAVEDKTSKSVVIENTTELVGVQFLRKDGAERPTDFSGAVALVGDRGERGDIAFSPSAPMYPKSADRVYFRAYYPSGVVESSSVRWVVGGDRDILVGSIFDAGNYTNPLTGAGGDKGSPMVFGHVLAQLEVKCVADPSASASEALVQFIWGKVQSIELLETSTELVFDYATGVVSGAKSGSVALLQEDYATRFEERALTKEEVPLAAMLVGAASGTAPIKLRVTTEKSTEEVEVQLKSGSTPMGFEVGRKHTVTLQFNAAEKQILVSATKVSEWAVGYSAAPEVNQPPPPPPSLMVYGQAPFAAVGSLVGATTDSYNGYTGTVAEGKNGAYYTVVATAYDKERPYHRLEVALELENGGNTAVWATARSLCATKTTDGGGWRLPRVSEVHWIYQNRGALNAVPGFAALGSLTYWSASEYNTYNAWSVDFYTGYTTTSYRTDSKCIVRCVREGR